MEIPTTPLFHAASWTRVAPCERAALDALREILREREAAGGPSAVAGLGLFSVRRSGAFEAFLSPAAAAALAPQLDGLAVAPSATPPDEPGLKLEEGDVELWTAVVRAAQTADSLAVAW